MQIVGAPASGPVKFKSQKSEFKVRVRIVNSSFFRADNSDNVYVDSSNSNNDASAASTSARPKAYW